LRDDFLNDFNFCNKFTRYRLIDRQYQRAFFCQIEIDNQGAQFLLVKCFIDLSFFDFPLFKLRKLG